MASTLNRYREASSETFKCIHELRNIINARKFGKTKMSDVAFGRLVSREFGLSRFFCRKVSEKRGNGDLLIAPAANDVQATFYRNEPFDLSARNPKIQAGVVIGDRVF
jgi:hypothetical protein